MRPIFEELASQFAGKADFFMADIDEAQDFAKKMGVSMVPTFQVINPEGQVVRQFSGANEERLRDLFASIG